MQASKQRCEGGRMSWFCAAIIECPGLGTLLRELVYLATTSGGSKAHSQLLCGSYEGPIADGILKVEGHEEGDWHGKQDNQEGSDSLLSNNLFLWKLSPRPGRHNHPTTQETSFNPFVKAVSFRPLPLGPTF